MVPAGTNSSSPITIARTTSASQAFARRFFIVPSAVTTADVWANERGANRPARLFAQVRLSAGLYLQHGYGKVRALDNFNAIISDATSEDMLVGWLDRSREEPM